VNFRSRALGEIYAAQAEEWIARRGREILDEIARLQAAVRLHPSKPDLYASIARLYSESGDPGAALAVLRDGIAACASATGLFWQLVRMLRDSGRTEEAAALAVSASQEARGGLQFRFIERLILPVIYDTEEQVTLYRRRFAHGLKAFEKDILTGNPEVLRASLDALRNFANFYLPYQGCNDLALQRRYGSLAHQVMKAHYPQWTSALPMPAPAANGRVRVGYASSCFYYHTVARLFIGWLEDCDRDQLQIHSYHSGQRADSMTRRVREASDAFFYIPDDLEALCRQIRKDQLHVLIFPDIGMTPETTLLAALRLAPAQCMSWGHPVTSGLPTVDYFLSSELMEPSGAQQHYSERLVLLPGIGVCVEKPPVPRAILTKCRSAWGIPEDAVVYLCCQSLSKYLPRHDHIFPAIARHVPKARFVFLAHDYLPSGKFQARLQRVFSAAGLSSGDYCLMLPTQPSFDYWNLNLVADVFLDSLGWSGGMTSLDALACDLPIVTLPGELMRGRHSYALLTQLGITDTIASSESEYVDIAVRLGLDTEWRKTLVTRIAKAAGQLYSDRRSVRALESFVRQVAAGSWQRRHWGR
jgi:protein O-GlcNAc transferase